MKEGAPWKDNFKYEGIRQAINVIMGLLSDGKQAWQTIKTEMGKIGHNMEELKNYQEKLTDRVYQIEDWSRKPFTAATVKTYFAVVEKFYNGMCPCCGENQILNPIGGRSDSLETDHFKGPKWNKITEGWAICKDCHERLTHGYLRRDGGWVEQAFKAFQMRVGQYTFSEKDKKQEQIFQ